MPKKPTKSSITRKLDAECARITKLRSNCCWCLNIKPLQCAHIFSRTYRNTRWDLKNMVALCASCHFYGHRNPIAFTEFIKSYLGEYEYESLKLRHNAIKRWTLQEMLYLLKTLGRIN